MGGFVPHLDARILRSPGESTESLKHLRPRQHDAIFRRGGRGRAGRGAGVSADLMIYRLVAGKLGKENEEKNEYGVV